MSFERPRRLSARRGSISAPDPFAKNAEHQRSSFSTLTIVRVNPPEESSSPASSHSTISLKEPPTGRSRFSGSPGSRRHPPKDAKSDSPRLSFAFNSFSPARGPPSPGSPRSQNAPVHQRSRSSTSTKLSPEQLYELAKQASSPRPRSRSSANANMTPSPGGRSSPSSPHLQHHRGTSDPTASPGSATFASHNIAPAKFRPLPESIHLPFIDRPAEVAVLISSSPTNRLLAVLKQTFPSATQTPSPGAVGTSSPKSYFASHTILTDLPEDPVQWSYAQLHAFMTTAPRSRFPDALYVKKVKACILARSELIWERVRGALGVPDDLNDEEYLNSVVSEQEAYLTDSDDTDGPHTSDIDDNDVKGRGGDWDSWDSVLASPGSDRKLHSTSPSLSKRSHLSSLHDIEPLELSGSNPIPIPRDGGISFEDQMDDRLTSHVHGTESLLSVPATEGDNTVSPTPRSASPVYQQYNGSDSDESLTSYGVTIEPMLASSTSDLKGSSPAPVSMTGSDGIAGLGGIAEDEEEEEDAASEKAEISVSPDLPPEEIQGLRICTSAPSPLSSPKSNSRHITSSPDLTPRRTFRAPSSNGHESDGNESDYTYNPMADRTPGNPLFPSNFAGLAAGPTLLANNPSLRSAAPPPAPRYHSGFYQTSHSPIPGYLRPSTGLRSGFMSHYQKRNRLSREMSDVTASDYAITIGSGSSVVSVE